MCTAIFSENMDFRLVPEELNKYEERWIIIYGFRAKRVLIYILK